MKYEFPIIQTINDVLPYIEGDESFIVADKGDFLVIDYVVAFGTTFPEIIDNDFGARIRRECRGLVFNKKTGKIIRRPWHKFFNLAERPETSIDNVDLSQEHYILDKLDGSMISPFINPVNNEIYWGTRMCATSFNEDVEKFLIETDQTKKYEEFVIFCTSHGYTPIFEWVGPNNRIVLEYKEPKLILTGVRNIKNGNYHNFWSLQIYSENWDIPVVEMISSAHATSQELSDYISKQVQTEGVVVVFGNHRIKIKTDEYRLLHKVKGYFDFEKDVVDLILQNKLDDLLPMLSDDQKTKVIDFAIQLRKFVNNHTVETIYWVNKIVDDNMDRKTFSLTAHDVPSVIRNTVFHNWNNLNVFTYENIVNSVISGYTSATTSHSRWREFKVAQKIDVSW